MLQVKEAQFGLMKVCKDILKEPTPPIASLV
jgi:hypothetical protein